MSTGGRREAGKILAASCGACGREIRAPAKQAGRRVRCPHCHGVVVLPGGAAPVETLLAAAVPDDRLLVKCPTCAAQFLARKEHAGRHSKCAKCGTLFVIPRLETAAAAAIEPDAFSISPFGLDDDPEGYAISTPAVRPVVAIEFPEEPRAIAERIELDAAPRWLFFSGVFDFPFRGEAASRWLSLTLLLALLGGLCVAIAIFITGEEGELGVVGAGFFVLAGLWAFIITASFGSNCAKAIVEDTAAGSERVGSWPEADWRTWFFPLVAVGYVAFLCLTVGYVLHLAVKLAPLEWHDALNFGAFVVVPFLLFPVLVLSGLECDSMLVPFSAPILASLFRHPGGWVGFYLFAALLGVVVMLPTVVLAPFLLGILSLFYFAPAASTATFLYARLLGRLAWRVSQVRERDDDEKGDSSKDLA